ncbi:MAG TPA: 16S rRNA (cytosine(1402)-N(4))-methyltransferase RsmH [Saprospiraceae bacterium]|nr:16S rRNA (cytosine(1402)-N(4))-methyltransferase RsmH [Saprospiraceae bacterium]
MSRSPEYHTPVLFERSIEELLTNNNSAGVYVDVTYGSGGHSERILSALHPEGKLIAFDQDADARQNLIKDERLHFVQGNFEHLGRFLDYFGITRIDGLLADLGVSSHQFDEKRRGFSFQSDMPLDMRMNTSSDSLTARDILRDFRSEELIEMFSQKGEVRFAKSLVAEIVAFRNAKEIQTAQQLVEIAKRASKGRVKTKELAQIFQALRIEVNQELEVLKKLLQEAGRRLSDEGRIVVISYHSLEDRLVKRFFQYGNFKGQPRKDMYGKILRPLRPLNKKPIVPDTNEIERNPRARSAKMRVAVKETKE